jgi:hypothetical protein
MMIVSDAPSCGITYECLSSNSRSVILENINSIAHVGHHLRLSYFYSKDTDVYSTGITYDDHHMFIVQATVLKP